MTVKITIEVEGNELWRVIELVKDESDKYKTETIEKHAKEMVEQLINQEEPNF